MGQSLLRLELVARSKTKQKLSGRQSNVLCFGDSFKAPCVFTVIHLSKTWLSTHREMILKFIALILNRKRHCFLVYWVKQMAQLTRMSK